MMEMVMNFCAPLNVWAPDDPVSRVLWDGGAGRQHWGPGTTAGPVGMALTGKGG